MVIPTPKKAEIETLRSWCNGEWLLQSDDRPVFNLSIDTRKIVSPEHTLFVALKTNRRNGHDFIDDAYEKGVRSFLVSDDVNIAQFKSANFIKVTDTLVALQQIAANNRKQYDVPVIGITGSNGKTIVKEWLNQLLSNDINIVRNPKSYNSQVGVPLSVWMMEPEHELGIFEAGISQPGEMDALERIIHPTMGIFTNIGEAHSEGFMSIRQKTNEKLLLFRYAKQLIYCKDYPELNQCIATYKNNTRGHEGEEELQLFTWSHKEDADLKVVSITKQPDNSAVITAIVKEQEQSITIPFSDHASVENAIHCWCAMVLLGIEQQVIEERMSVLQPVSMRMELRHGVNDCTIINDTYNSDLTSLLISLEYLEQQKQHQHHTVIMSDMLQLGMPDAELYEQVAELIGSRKVHRFIGIGPALYKNKSQFRKYKNLRSIFFKTTDDFLKNFHLLTFEKEAILLKGARTFTFEKIGVLLEQKVHQTVLSINLSALKHNLNVFRKKLKPNVKLMAMVKAFSYGSGSYEIANLLQYQGVDYLTVAYTDEGVALRKAGITLPVMVMSPDMNSFDRMIAWKLEPEIYNFASLHAFLDIATTLQVEDYPIHIKLDTGMHRLGFEEEDLDRLIELLEETPHVYVASIFSHLAASEDPTQDSFTGEQSKAFDVMTDKLMKKLHNKPLRHLCNSAAISRHPELHYDMVRLGLGLYGVDTTSTTQNKLQQISTLKTTIAQIKTVPAKETVGYGRKGSADKEMKIATVSIGYADGYPRSLGNGKGHMLVHGQQAKIVGVVCMDMCMIDVTDIPQVKEGDEVIVFSPELPVPQLASWAGTIPYEIMTGISQRVKRVYQNED